MTVAVVTDSTSYLPQGLAEQFDITVVPLRVTIGDRTGIEGVDITPADVTKALRAKGMATTSRPSPAEFARVFQAALDGGASHVVSVHLSATLSGTWESARLASEDFAFGSVRIVDSRSTGMALGFAALAAARASREGLSPAAVQDAAVSTVDRTESTFYVDSLEFLRRGGRIGAAASLLGSSLSMKPLLHLVNGRVVVLEKVRTSSRAIARLIQRTVEVAGDGPVDLAIHHLDAPVRAAEVAARLREALPSVRDVHLSEVGAVVGAHIGPGMVATVVVRL
jgi:DegV family protein with EDD domain